MTEQALAINEQHKSVPIDLNTKGAKIAPANLPEVVEFAKLMCKADIALPKHLRGNAGACMAVALQAMDWEMSPFQVASKSYVVNGAIAYEAQLIAAVVNTRSGIQGRLKYSFEGEGEYLTCTVTGRLDDEDYSYTSPPMGSITTKNSPLWKSDPQQQLGYFSARSWARRYTPEVILGAYDRDEAQNFGPEYAKDVTNSGPKLIDRLQQANEDNGGGEQQEGFSTAGSIEDAETLPETSATQTPAQTQDYELDLAHPRKKPLPLRKQIWGKLMHWGSCPWICARLSRYLPGNTTAD